MFENLADNQNCPAGKVSVFSVVVDHVKEPSGPDFGLIF
jgi:hypothetical protein